MKPFFSLIVMILSVTTFSQTVILTETFPTIASAGNCVVNFRIVDMTGKIVLQQQNKIYQGNNSISVNNLDRLQPGVYLLQMDNSEELTTAKFNVAR